MFFSCNVSKKSADHPFSSTHLWFFYKKKSLQKNVCLPLLPLPKEKKFCSFSPPSLYLSSAASHYPLHCAPFHQCVILTHHHGRAMLLATCPCSLLMAERGPPHLENERKKKPPRVVQDKWKKPLVF